MSGIIVWRCFTPAVLLWTSVFYIRAWAQGCGTQTYELRNRTQVSGPQESQVFAIQLPFAVTTWDQAVGRAQTLCDALCACAYATVETDVQGGRYNCYGRMDGQVLVEDNSIGGSFVSTFVGSRATLAPSPVQPPSTSRAPPPSPPQSSSPQLSPPPSLSGPQPFTPPPPAPPAEASPEPANSQAPPPPRTNFSSTSVPPTGTTQMSRPPPPPMAFSATPPPPSVSSGPPGSGGGCGDQSYEFRNQTLVKWLDDSVLFNLTLNGTTWPEAVRLVQLLCDSNCACAFVTVETHAVGGGYYCQGKDGGHVLVEDSGTSGTFVSAFIGSRSMLGEEGKRRNIQLVVGLSLGGCSLLALTLAAIIVAWRLRRLKRRLSKLDLPLRPNAFSYHEIEVATRNFSDQLGAGAQGRVFKGVLPSGKAIAVKVIDIAQNEEAGLKAFNAEARTLGTLSHRNICRFVGWCAAAERNQLFLCYEFMPHGCLSSWLFPRDTSHPNAALPWDVRWRVVVGLAEAVAYLHEGWEQKVVHRDIKCSNVMLDSDFNAQLGDFGLAFAIDHGQMIASMTNAGTLHYLPPEAHFGARVDEKWDVFAFGMVTLEIVSGRQALDVTKAPSQVRLALYAWEVYEQGQAQNLADPRLEGRFDVSEVAILVRLGLTCTLPNPLQRPTMKQVVAALQGDGSSNLQPPATRPPELVLPDYMLSDASRSNLATTGSDPNNSSKKRCVGTAFADALNM